jgi:hypothetical protein
MVDQDVLALSYSQDQRDADAKLAFPNHCLHQGLLIHPAPNHLDNNTCYGATVIDYMLQCNIWLDLIFYIILVHMILKKPTLVLFKSMQLQSLLISQFSDPYSSYTFFQSLIIDHSFLHGR